MTLNDTYMTRRFGTILRLRAARLLKCHNPLCFDSRKMAPYHIIYVSQTPNESLACRDLITLRLNKTHIPSSRKGTEKSKEKGKEIIVRLLLTQPSMTTEALMKQVGLSRSGIEKVIRQLKKDGAPNRIGPDMGGRWEVHL